MSCALVLPPFFIKYSSGIISSISTPDLISCRIWHDLEGLGIKPNLIVDARYSHDKDVVKVTGLAVDDETCIYLKFLSRGTESAQAALRLYDIHCINLSGLGERKGNHPDYEAVDSNKSGFSAFRHLTKWKDTATVPNTSSEGGGFRLFGSKECSSSPDIQALSDRFDRIEQRLCTYKADRKKSLDDLAKMLTEVGQKKVSVQNALRMGLAAERDQNQTPESPTRALEEKIVKLEQRVATMEGERVRAIIRAKELTDALEFRDA